MRLRRPAHWRESLLWSLPALLALAVLLLAGRIGPSSLAAGWLIALLPSAWLATGRMRELESMAAWLEKLPEAPSAGFERMGGEGVLARRLMRPIRRIARRIRRQDRALAVQGRMLAAIVEAMPDPILIVTADLTVAQANAAARREFAIREQDLPLARVLRDPGIMAAARGALQSRAASSVTFTPTVGRPKQFSARIEPLEMVEQEAGVLIAVREQTRQVMIERMRSDFVANASHELRNPLAALQGAIETLRGPARHDPQAQEMFLELMDGEARRMSRLVDDLLSLSRIELIAHQPPTERCDLKAVLEQVIGRMEAVAAPAEVGLVALIPATLPAIAGDADQLDQLFANIIDNAVKYGGQGRTVWIEAAAVESAPPEAGPAASRPCIRVSVRDEGTGIPREHIPRLTERFYRVDTARSRRLRGTGLGLAIVKHILRRHQGHLAIESEPGKGSTFTVYLPMPAAG